MIYTNDAVDTALAQWDITNAALQCTQFALESLQGRLAMLQAIGQMQGQPSNC